VLPIDWLIIENILNLGNSELDHETIVKLKDSFAKIVREERNAREQLERTLRNYAMMKTIPGQTDIGRVYELMHDRD
jgi:protein-arginine kinase